MVGLSTWCRGDAVPDAFLARAERLGAVGVVLDFTVGELEPWALPLAARGPSLPLWAACLPAGPGDPRPAAADGEERIAARKAAAAWCARGAELGARILIVRLGELEVRFDHGALARAFARRTVETEYLERLAGERAALSRHALDRARFGVDALLGAAGGLTVALATRARWTDVPNDVEIRALLEDFRGARLAVWPDAAAESIRRRLLQPVDRGLFPRAAGAFLADAAGLRGGLPWGRGEVDRDDFVAALPADAYRVVHAAVGTDDELTGPLRRG
ncbi:MAG TPA: hypothetical protein VKE22_21565 [Haliangiales bacterium]|nr:hypothetical protein [Haliangiales bacterium]